MAADRPRRQDHAATAFARDVEPMAGSKAQMPGSKSDTSTEMHEELRRLGARLAEARKIRQLKRSDVASAIGCDADHVGKLERGQSWPGGLLLYGLCKRLAVSADWVLFGEGAGPRMESKRVTRRPYELVKDGSQTVGRPMRELPDAVVGYLATAGTEISPEVVEKIKRFDYSELGLKKLTIQQVKNIAALLAEGADGHDD